MERGPFDAFLTAYMTGKTSTTEALLELLEVHADKAIVTWFIETLSK